MRLFLLSIALAFSTGAVVNAQPAFRSLDKLDRKLASVIRALKIQERRYCELAVEWKTQAITRHGKERMQVDSHHRLITVGRKMRWNTEIRSRRVDSVNIERKSSTRRTVVFDGKHLASFTNSPAFFA